jgi:hypothetical protein
MGIWEKEYSYEFINHERGKSVAVSGRIDVSVDKETHTSNWDQKLDSNIYVWRNEIK